ncbi:MAG: twin transmembrane helix small protein [Pseudomonadota bacterium]
MRLIIILLLLGILASLGSGLFYLTRDQQDGSRLVRALTWRIGLSLVLFGALILSGWMGWITPGEL